MEDISFKRILRFSITATITLLLIAYIFGIGIASAESGTISVSNQTYFYNPGLINVGGGDVNYFPSLLFYTTNYNSIDDFYIIFVNNNTFKDNGNYTTFTCQSPNTCSGDVSYNKYGKIIDWDFYGAGTNIVASPVTLIYADDIFNSNSIDYGAVPSATRDNAIPNSSYPVCVNAGLFGGVYRCLSSVNSIGFSATGYARAQTTVDYDISYPSENKYVGTITKSGTIYTHVDFLNSTAIQMNESSYTNESFVTGLVPYTTGLRINVTLNTSSYTLTTVNQTGVSGYVPPEDPPEVNAEGVGIKVNPTSAYLSQVFNVSWLRTINTPLLHLDKIEIYYGSERVEQVISPSNSGYIKFKPSYIGSYRASFTRTNPFLSKTELDYQTFEVLGNQTSYLIMNNSFLAGKQEQITYFDGQPGNNYLNVYYLDSSIGQYVFTDVYNTVTGTETTVTYDCTRISKYKFVLESSGTSKIIDCVANNKYPQWNIARSNISLSKSTASFGDWVYYSYQVDNANWTNNLTYLTVRDANAIEVYNQTLAVQKKDNVDVELSNVKNEIMNLGVSQGVNLVFLNSSNGKILAQTSITISSINAEGYGLNLKDLFCTNEKMKFTYYAPDKAIVNITKSGTNVRSYTNLNLSLSGKTVEFVLNTGDYVITIFSTNGEQQISKSFKVVADCDAIATVQTGFGSGIDGIVILIFGELTDITKFVFAIAFMIVGFIFGGRTQIERGSLIGLFLAFLIMAFIGYIPVWVIIITVIVLIILSRIFR